MNTRTRNFWDTNMTLATNSTRRVSLMPREKKTGPLEPVLSEKMLKLAESQIVNI